MMEQQRVEKTRKRMNELPIDILVEVLWRLPHKSLCRFTCVSKEWHSLISSPDPGLVKDLRHQRLHPNPYLCIWDRKNFNQDRGTLRVSIVDTATERIQGNYYLPVTYSGRDHMVSCHNLVCFVGRIISIHNLSTQETTMLPDSGPYFDVGFGYSSLANEYKLVKWFAQENNGIKSLGCKIFSLSDRLRFKSDSWRLTETRSNFEDLDIHPVSVNGVIYWLKRNYPDFYQPDSILALDLDKEESKIISCPKRSPATEASLLELKECLYLAHCWTEKAIVKMWRLEDPKNCVWISEYYINFPSMCNPIVPITSVLAGHVETLVFLSLQGRHLLYYNVESGTMRTPDKLWHLKQHWLQVPCVLKYMEF